MSHDIEDRLDGIEQALASGRSEQIALRYLRRIERKLDAIHLQGETIMANQEQAAERLESVADNLEKIGLETDQLIKEIADLRIVITEGPITPRMEAALAKVETRAKSIDDKVADITPPAPA